MNNLLKRGVLCSAALLPLVVFTPPANAALSFTFDYTDNTPGVGFLDSNQGAARQQALSDAASSFASLFNGHFTNMGVVNMKVTSSDDASSSTLASAGSELLAGSNNRVGEVIRTKLQTGTDLNDAAADGTVDVNWGQTWSLSASAVGVGSGEFDFYSTIYHELVHALGWLSIPDQSGQSVAGETVGVGPGEWSQFDQFITDKNGNPLIGASGVLDKTLWDAESIGGASPAGGLFFNGANAAAANGGNPVGLYTPTTWEDGSSVSHTDDENPALAGTLMLAATDAGPGARTFSAIEFGVLQDIGYSVVPVPAAVWLFGSALVMLFGIGERRKAA